MREHAPRRADDEQHPDRERREDEEKRGEDRLPPLRFEQDHRIRVADVEVQAHAEDDRQDRREGHLSDDDGDELSHRLLARPTEGVPETYAR